MGKSTSEVRLVETDFCLPLRAERRICASGSAATHRSEESHGLRHGMRGYRLAASAHSLGHLRIFVAQQPPEPAEPAAWAHENTDRGMIPHSFCWRGKPPHVLVSQCPLLVRLEHRLLLVAWRRMGTNQVIPRTSHLALLWPWKASSCQDWQHSSSAKCSDSPGTWSSTARRPC